MSAPQQALTQAQLAPFVRRALAEDLKTRGDITTEALVGAEQQGQAVLRSRQAGVLAGLEAARLTFASLDEDFAFEALAADGTRVAAGEEIARLKGSARALLSGERTALNFLGRLSGIATATAQLVERIGGCRAKLCCTRKTTPGLRLLEKYAVRMGGGINHRFGLYDAILIKDNHIALAGGIGAALARVRAIHGAGSRIEIEADTLDQVAEALAGGADVILLDNMSPAQCAQAVALAGGRAVLEASGGITPETAAAVAASGVDYISAGWITHSAPSLDLGLDMG